MNRLNATILLLIACQSPLSAGEFEPFFYFASDTSSISNSAYSDNLIHRNYLETGFDLELSDSSNFHFAYSLLRGDNGTEVVNDFQYFSNIDDDSFSKYFEVWYQASYQQWRFKAGLIDVNLEFAMPERGAEFIHSAMGYSPTIFSFPTYPNPAKSLMFFYQLNESSQIKYSLSAEQSWSDKHQPFHISEYRHQLDDNAFTLGYWYHATDFEQFVGEALQNGSGGFYLIYEGDSAEISLLNTSLGYFIQLGSADPNVSDVEYHIGGGLVAFDPWNTSGHAIGLGLTRVFFSHGLQTDKAHESVIEGFYKLPLTEGVSFKFDLQHMSNPYGEGDRQPDFIFTLRFEVDL